MAAYEVDEVRAAEYRLSPRELEVLRLAVEGLNSQEIGLRLHISENTVRTHFAHVARKLGARNACQVGACAVELGILRPT
jgi:DNA-binding NarL/FixJ family response regulator